MKKQKLFNVSLSYNQIMILNMLIDDYIMEMDSIGKDVMNDRECKLAREAKNELLGSYLGYAK